MGQVPVEQSSRGSHRTIGDSMCNCVSVQTTATRTGFSKLGIQNVGGLSNAVTVNTAVRKVV